MRQTYPIPPLGMPSTGEVVEVEVFDPFDPLDGTTVMRLTTANPLDAPDIATSLGFVNAHTALGPTDGLTTGKLEAFGSFGRVQNFGGSG